VYIQRSMTTDEHPLKAARVAAGLDQDGLAGRSGVSQATISRVEAGHSPTTSTALRLARALNSTVEALFGHVVADDLAAANATPAPADVAERPTVAA
jgi:transcriptional regulator with XRE-family HTH domain